MDEDIQSQIERAKELMRELEKACNDDLQAKNVSGKTKNLSQEVLLKIRHLLDQAVYKFFEKHYFPNLSDSEKKATKVYFPIVSKKEDLKSVLSRANMINLELDHPNFYQFLDSVQPYNVEYSWLKLLSSLAIDKHKKLTPQIRVENKTMTAKTENISVTIPIDNPNFSIHQGEGVQVSIGGVPVKFTNQGIVPLSQGLKTEITKWVSFLFEDSDVNVLWLCRKSVEDGEKIIKKVLEFV
ncbi:MAG: hypothetical protein UW07_C0039G0022 [Candidatus Nomurabacteria bacterium GW2011_GWF2_43_8]|uniref:Uncharacterized protein n=3 Tax=Candidatus Nomuraibacteriota TaxID=1752729 RepID=A0A0G1IGK7_9BACT|nr:MAG: hypothetical protein UV76_C0001G0010 [Candidatus Nomurabacteria bacterium GW2011_GWA2_43_15]KKT19280.1 MAG: hypothetical protein UW02_C0012G0011 [Candidatus Nomurabacteria bacterium GW2011_GWB1_43_7]KKT22314.1 MAG: hypothetical protein UW07_C0039G0022 [Candidatus Nomurabacteria bacterium GW2011_GWF2_43_8]